MSNTINFTGTGGILEGDLGPANVDVNLDSVLEFDGVNDKITVSDHSSLDIVGDITLSAWVKITMGESDFKTIISKSASLNNDVSPWQLRIDDSDKVEFVTANGSSNSRASSTNSIKEGWNHIAVTVDENGSSSVVKYFINGVLDRTVSSGWTDYSGYSNSSDLLVGVLGTGYFHDGYLADVRIYNAVVSDADVAILASQINVDPALTRAGTTNLQGWWKLNNNSVTDSSPNSNNGTASGPTQRFDQFHVDVNDNSTQTDGTFEISQGKVEGKALTSLDFDGSSDKITSTSFTMDHNGATYAVWVKKANATGNEDVIIGQAADPNQHWLKIDTNGDIILRDYPNDLHCDTAITDTNWHHIVVTLSGDSNGAIYVDGVAQTLSANGIVGDPTFDVHGIRGTIDDFHGKMKDSKVFDYALSADQAASLYSGTYPQTPKHWWKMDDAGLHSTGEPYVEDYGTGTDSDGIRTGATWSNGTLDLYRGLYIKTNGVMSAPRGDLEISLDTGSYVVRNLSTVALPNNGSDAAVTGFAHNDGTVKLGLSTYGHNQQIGDNASHSITFYNLDVLSSWYDTRGTVYVENVLDLSSYRLRLGVSNMAANYIIGKASATSQSSASKAGGLNTGGYITGGGGFSMGTVSVSSTIQGASTIYPAIFNLDGSGGNNFAFGVAASQTAYQPRDSSYPLQLGNLDLVDAWTTVDVGLPLYYKFVGDMKFRSTVTIADEINLDLNGQRVEFGDDFDLTTGVLDWASSMVIFKGKIDLNGRFPTSDTNTVIIHDPADASKKEVISMYSNGTFFNLNNETEISGYGWTSGTADYVLEKVLVGGTFDCQQHLQAGNIQTATGGDLRGVDRTITCEGDFTTSGGLIGKSALDFDGTSTCRVADHSDFDSLTNATWMGWYKIDDVSSDRNFMGQSSSFSLQIIENSTNKPRFSLFSNTGAWTDLEGNTTITVDNKWHHIAFVMDGSNNKMYIYLDGKLDAEGAWTQTLNGSGADIYLGGYRSGNEKHFAGLYDSASFWNVALTSTQIRAKMLSDFADLDSNTGCKGWWQFDEGTGGNGDTTASSVGSHPATLGPAGNAPNWVGAGTFTKGTSTVNMTGASGELYLGNGGHDFNKLQVAPSGGSTALQKVTHTQVIVSNLLTHNGGTFSSPDNMSVKISSNGTISSGATIPYICYWTSTATVPSANFRFFIANINTVTLGGNCTFIGYLRTGAETIVTGAFSHSVRQLVIDSGGTMDLRDSTITMTGTTSSTNLHDPNSTFITGNTSIIGHISGSNKTNWLSPAAAGHEIVGNVSNLDFQAGNDLTIVGSVTNCVGVGFRQWNHTTDTKQLLDADPIADIRLNRPSLDNANELQTGG